LKIKLTNLDRLFSKYIRARDQYCQRCGSPRSLQCSHFWGRAKKSVRFDEENCIALCFGCHAFLGAHPALHRDFFLERLGQERYDLLEARAYQVGKPDVAALTLYYNSKIEEVSNGNV